jgi:putative FmdB family regulatory protein
MPLYEYQCKAGHRTELRLLFEDKPAHTRCQTCGKQARPILSATPGIVRNPAVPRGRP